MCERCGDSGHKTVKYPDQVCGVCGGKGHAVEIPLLRKIIFLVCGEVELPLRLPPECTRR